MNVYCSLAYKIPYALCPFDTFIRNRFGCAQFPFFSHLFAHFSSVSRRNVCVTSIFVPFIIPASPSLLYEWCTVCLQILLISRDCFHIFQHSHKMLTPRFPIDQNIENSRLAENGCYCIGISHSKGVFVLLWCNIHSHIHSTSILCLEQLKHFFFFFG